MSEPGEFNPEKALREEIEGLANILITLSIQTNQAERLASEAAAQFDALIKLKAFAQQELKRKRDVLTKLQEDVANGSS
jgi:hypothetical protein